MYLSRFLHKFTCSNTKVYRRNTFVSLECCLNCDLLPIVQYCTNCSAPLRSFYTSNKYLFWERDEKSGYGSKENKLSRFQMIREGLHELRQEISLWKDEVKEKFQNDPIIVYRPGETDIMWKFDSPESLSFWNVTSDSDHGEGFSNCALSITPGKKCLFSGALNTTVPKDGRVKRAGYCSMRSHRIRKSFKRDAYYEWEQYTHLVMRVRGDGRSYLLNLSTPGYYDILWNDVYHYVLFTRGGPYWQLTKIPFSKFFLSSKGRVQDKQEPIPLNRIANFGITLGDGINGPFHLEIDYIGLEFDPAHQEKFAYEMYKTDQFITGC